MSEETSGSAPAPNPRPRESPGGRPMGAAWITVVTLYLVFVAIVVFHGLVVLWPLNRVDTNTDVTARLARIEEALEIQKTPAAQETPAQETPAAEAQDLTSDAMGTDLGPTEPTEPAGTDFTSSETPEPASTPAGSAIPWKECGPGGQLPVKIFWLDFCLSGEQRLFLIVMFAGALGGLVHAVRSFYWYAGCRKLVLSWTGFYITLPVLGAAMATMFYLVMRGGFFPQASNTDASPFGFAALAVLIGMFTEQAAVKLKQILETFLAEAPKGTDHAGGEAVQVSAIAPLQGPKAGDTPVTILGKGFAQNAGVSFGGVAAKDIKVAADGASLTATTPGAAAPGPVTVEVNNPAGKKGSLVNGYTYV